VTRRKEKKIINKVTAKLLQSSVNLTSLQHAIFVDDCMNVFNVVALLMDLLAEIEVQRKMLDGLKDTCGLIFVYQEIRSHTIRLQRKVIEIHTEKMIQEKADRTKEAACSNDDSDEVIDVNI
jgi:hypothetical protein